MARKQRNLDGTLTLSEPRVRFNWGFSDLYGPAA
jgi:hypothetical protein